MFPPIDTSAKRAVRAPFTRALALVGVWAPAVISLGMGLLARDVAPLWPAVPLVVGGLAFSWPWLRLPEERGLLGLGALLCALTVFVLPDSAVLLERTREGAAWPHLDLTSEASPSRSHGFAEIEGFLRHEWVLDEHEVDEGARPDQNKPAKAVLIPLVNQAEGTVALRGPLIVARISPTLGKPTTKIKLRGKLKPIDQALVDTLVQAGGLPAEQDLPGLMLDTLVVPTRSEAITQALVVLLFLGLATTCALGATRVARADP